MFVAEMAVEAFAPWEQHRIGDAGTMLRFEMPLEEARHFHDVRVGVVNDAAAGVGHCPSVLFVVCESLA
jgi:hypothetical protein